MPNEKQLANLRPWQPGQSGNPAGSSTTSRYKQEIEALLADALLDEVDGKTRAAAIIDQVVSQAEEGQPWACKLLLDRILPATQKHEVTAPDASSVEELLEQLERIRSQRFVPTEEEQAALEAELRREPKH